MIAVKKRIKYTLDEILALCDKFEYKEQYAFIKQKINSGQIKPIKSSGTNGKTPALPLKYWHVLENDFTKLKEELMFGLSAEITIEYYLNHLDVYEQDREAVIMLSNYFKNNAHQLLTSMSLNERSYAIWKKEKFLGQDGGKRILKHCGIESDKLNYYETSEPFSYFTINRDVPQTVLIIENKDTFYSMRQHLLDGHEKILGRRVDTLIYGAGKRILRSFKDFDISSEPYLRHEKNCFIYFGDLDYEGILIYQQLRGVAEQINIKAFVEAYEAMIYKSNNINELPLSKEQQNHSISEDFFDYFSEEIGDKMKLILELGRYIPQESLTRVDFDIY